MKAFMAGFNEIIPPEWLSCFDERELEVVWMVWQWLVCLWLVFLWLCCVVGGVVAGVAMVVLCSWWGCG